MNPHRLIIALLACVCFLMTSRAQNSIDDKVNRLSTAGNATFTSAIERDPLTRKVVKVVKVLECQGETVNAIRKAFEQEQESGRFSRSQKSDKTVMILTTESQKELRIYMLELTGRYYPQGKTTIIIKPKN